MPSSGGIETAFTETIPPPIRTLAPLNSVHPPGTKTFPAPDRSVPPDDISPEPLPSPTSVLNIDILMQTCPTSEEIDRFHRDLDLFFDPVSEFPAYTCELGINPEESPNRRWVLYQALRAIGAIHFDQPLPWTSLPLYDWLEGAINGIALSETEYSYCCDAQHRIVLKADLFDQEDMKTWVNPQSGHGLIGLIGLIVHEARHAEVGGHTCGNDDATFEEMGAWGTQYYLFMYIAEHTSEGFFSADQRQSALYHAEVARSRICTP